MRTTLNIEDELLEEMKIQAVRRHTTLTALVEEAFREWLRRAEAGRRRTELPSVDGGGFPDGFPLHSGSAMVEFLEKQDARR